jgi:predicted esterase
MTTQRSARRAAPPALLVGAILVTVGQAGCTSPLRDSGPSSLLADADWPPRITAGLEQLAANVPAVLSPEQNAEPEKPIYIVRSAAYGLGLVLELDDAEAESHSGSARERELVFVSFSPLARGEEYPGDRPARVPGKITLGDLRAGVHWHLYEPKDGSPRGLVVHLGGNKYVRRALLADGWVVLSASNTGRCLQRRANPVSFEIERGEPLKQAAARIAAVFDDELADWPYSLEAVLQYLADHRPDIRQTPAAIMGFSIGALALPAVVARLPDDFGAAVLVAGGANLLEISHRTSKPDSGIELRWVGEPPGQEDWQELYAAYLEQAKLDPYHTAAALTGMPVLIYHGHFDQVVPAATGEMLFARVGEAQRYVFPVGHRQMLRVVMLLQAGRIVDWTQAALAAPPDVHPRQGAPAN